jgi:hypothetical protein
MGEIRVVVEGILGNFDKKEDNLVEDKCLSTVKNFSYMNTFDVDKLKYVHGKAFGYNKCKFSSTLEAALMVKTMNGEKQHGF